MLNDKTQQLAVTNHTFPANVSSIFHSTSWVALIVLFVYTKIPSALHTENTETRDAQSAHIHVRN